MTTSDYVLDIALIAIVLLQVRGRRLTPRSQLIPLAIVAWAADNYLHGIPTAGNDLVLIAGCAAVGTVLGTLCALFTSVRPDAQGMPVAKAGVVAAGLWILGVGARFAFQLYATHGGQPAIARFSLAHDITSSEAWTAALVLMALCEVVTRVGILAWRGYAVRQTSASVAGEPATLGATAVGEPATMRGTIVSSDHGQF
jgi:hypothetical protein